MLSCWHLENKRMLSWNFSQNLSVLFGSHSVVASLICSQKISKCPQVQHILKCFTRNTISKTFRSSVNNAAKEAATDSRVCRPQNNYPHPTPKTKWKAVRYLRKSSQKLIKLWSGEDQHCFQTVRRDLVHIQLRIP